METHESSSGSTKTGKTLLLVDDTPENLYAIGSLLQPHYRVRVANGGAELGLAISHDLFELMGGRLLVDSSPATGSTFSCALQAPNPVHLRGRPGPCKKRQQGEANGSYWNSHSHLWRSDFLCRVSAVSERLLHFETRRFW